MPIAGLVHFISWFDTEEAAHVVENVEHFDSRSAIGHLKAIRCMNQVMAEQCLGLRVEATAQRDSLRLLRGFL